MNKRQLTSALTAVLIAVAGLAATTTPAQAATSSPVGNRSVMRVLAKDGHHLDTNWSDFDVFEKFARGVIKARPHSKLTILAHGGQPVTALIPTDRGYKRAAQIIFGHHFSTERSVYKALNGAGGPKFIEGFLLNCLVGDETLTYRELRMAAPTRVDTLQGTDLLIRYRNGRLLVVDHAKASPNARVIRGLSNINKGNEQIIHGISVMPGL